MTRPPTSWRRLRALVFASCLASGCGGEEGSLDSAHYAITSGEPTTGYGHVVQLRAPETGALRCSANLISENVLLTAAHCLVEGEVPLCAHVETVTGDEDVPVVAHAVHPEFAVLEPMAARFANDLALLRLARPLGVLPNPVELTQTVALGESLRAVGYGRTAADRHDEGSRRYGDSMVAALRGREFELGGERLPCVFDSGGAVLSLDGGRQVGVISSGDASCVDHTRVMRLDVAAATIGDFVAASDAVPRDEASICALPTQRSALKGSCAFSPTDRKTRQKWIAGLLGLLLVAMLRRRCEPIALASELTEE